MKLHWYFRDVRWPQRPEIRLEWIEEVVRDPRGYEERPDGRTKYWGYIAEMDKYLRVIVLEDGETVLNAFFDRRFRG